MIRPGLALALLLAGCSYSQRFELPGDTGSGGSTTGVDGGCASESDPENCGACGHSCLGGDCSFGRCQPLLIAEGEGSSAWQGYTDDIGDAHDGPDRLAVDSTHVYWLNLRGEVRRAPVMGGPAETVTLTPGAPCWIALSKTEVFFSTLAGNVFHVNKSGGTSLLFSSPPVERPGITLLSGAYPTEIFIDQDQLYWADGGGIYSCPLTGCEGAPQVLMAGSDDQRPFSFARTGGGAMNASVEVWRVESPNSSTVEYALTSFVQGQWIGLSGPTGHYELHGDQDATYALTLGFLGASSVVRIEDQVITHLASGKNVPPYPVGLALDENFVYWANGHAFTVDPAARRASVVRCAKSGCLAPEVLAPNQIVPRAVAVSDDAVFWTTGDGKVLKLAKSIGPSPE